ncbi:MAG: hypothetical protein H7289_12275 [Mucilaginibacter sp.]|nr:hypothetical protein [Mucilaginibacter sp.]
MTYSGNKLFNPNNIVLAVLILLYGAGFFSTHGSDIKFFCFVIIPLFFLITTSEAFYFETTPDELIIKNYLIPFLNITYNLSEISEVKLLNTGYRSTSKARLKVIRGNKGSIGFRGASLGIQDWQDLVTDLSIKKVVVTLSDSGPVAEIGLPE